MPQSLPIQAIPNQSFIITLDSNLYEITLKTTNGIISVSLIINGVDTIDNIRAVAGTLIIPSRYEEAGNLMFLTDAFDLPIYTEFNKTQSLVYFTAAELAVYRTPVAIPVTASDFNPLGGLPLRFSPQNYS